MYLCTNHLNTTEGKWEVWNYANESSVPKIRAHKLENVSFSTLMAIGEKVSSDSFLGSVPAVSLHAPDVRKYTSRSLSDLKVLLSDTSHDKAHQSTENTRWYSNSQRNPEPGSCDSVKVTLLTNKKKPLHLCSAVKSFVTATGDPSAPPKQRWCTRALLKGKTREFHYLNHRNE